MGSAAGTHRVHTRRVAGAEPVRVMYITSLHQSGHAVMLCDQGG